ncbi:MAG: bifunctional glutamate N-acetyltransferase/amino-acid acetyltransferase ArgJ [Nitrospinota bacterium]|nr:bifunctional glutamate N-acetyltransferase/amino-acid acetyltransferase ArgJ [Nitrospinota bacterium]
MTESNSAMVKGFRFASMVAGIKKKPLDDLGIIVSDRPCTAAGLFTKNMVKAAPVLVSQKHLKSPKQFGVVCNSGCANAVTGSTGMKDAVNMAKVLADGIGCKASEILVASTGVIGQFLPMPKLETGIPALIKGLNEHPEPFSRAIMTTDTVPKTAFKTVKLGGKDVAIWGTSKGAGMLHPNMATMLAFIVTDAAIPKLLLKSLLKEVVDVTFNCISVDGDTSTNDSVFLLANGAAGNAPLKKGTADYRNFASALREVSLSLSEQIILDAEGATVLAEIKVEKGKSLKEAVTVARTIAGSLLVKTALNGRDANWGRIICAAGYSGAKVDPEKMELYFGEHCAYRKGAPVSDMEEKLTAEMKKKRVNLRLVLNQGKASASYLFSDISREYVSINADYRS